MPGASGNGEAAPHSTVEATGVVPTNHGPPTSLDGPVDEAPATQATKAPEVPAATASAATKVPAAPKVALPRPTGIHKSVGYPKSWRYDTFQPHLHGEVFFGYLKEQEKQYRSGPSRYRIVDGGRRLHNRQFVADHGEVGREVSAVIRSTTAGGGEVRRTNEWGKEIWEKIQMVSWGSKDDREAGAWAHPTRPLDPDDHDTDKRPLERTKDVQEFDKPYKDTFPRFFPQQREAALST